MQRQQHGLYVGLHHTTTTTTTECYNYLGKCWRHYTGKCCQPL